MLECTSLFGSEPNKPRAGSEETSSFNLAKLSAEARVAYVSSGSLPLAKRMIDGNTTTAFDFSNSDPHPTVIVELAQTQRLHRVTALCNVEDRLEIYLLNRLGSNPADVLKGKPVAFSASSVEGKAAVDFDPQGACYAALRWTRKKPVTGEFRVAEVGAFAVGSNSVFDLTEPPFFVQSVIQTTSNGGPDFSNTLGTLAAPPTMPPDLTPTSP